MSNINKNLTSFVSFCVCFKKSGTTLKKVRSDVNFISFYIVDNNVTMQFYFEFLHLHKRYVVEHVTFTYFVVCTYLQLLYKD